jgi:hypothetical protein
MEKSARDTFPAQSKFSSSSSSGENNSYPGVD